MVAGEKAIIQKIASYKEWKEAELTDYRIKIKICILYPI